MNVTSGILLAGLLSLAGCANVSWYGDHKPVAPPLLAAAYDLGSRYAAVQYCQGALGEAVLRDTYLSAQLLLSSYPVAYQDAARTAFQAGAYEGGGFSSPHRVPCDELRSQVPDFIAESLQQSATWLRAGGGYPARHSGN